MIYRAQGPRYYFLFSLSYINTYKQISKDTYILHGRPLQIDKLSKSWSSGRYDISCRRSDTRKHCTVNDAVSVATIIWQHCWLLLYVIFLIWTFILSTYNPKTIWTILCCMHFYIMHCIYFNVIRNIKTRLFSLSYNIYYTLVYYVSCTSDYYNFNKKNSNIIVSCTYIMIQIYLCYVRFFCYQNLF